MTQQKCDYRMAQPGMARDVQTVLLRPVSKADDMSTPTEWAGEWANRHCDAWHPGTRDDCEHCQEMIRLYGPMPSKELMWSLERPQAPERTKEAIPETLRWQVWERDNFTCQRCGSRQRLSVDHIIPESRGGALDLSNLQTLCRSCNSSKGAKC